MALLIQHPVCSIFFSAQKVLTANKRSIKILGFFNSITCSNLELTCSDNGSITISGEHIIDLASVTTDAEGRDKNIQKHLFKVTETQRFVRVRIAGDKIAAATFPRNLPPTFEWRGRILFDTAIERGAGVMDGLQLPVTLIFKSTNFKNHTVWNARSTAAIAIPVSSLNLPFQGFLDAVGLPVIPDHVEIDWGLTFTIAEQERSAAHVCIVGAGIAGMAAAQALSEQGLRVTVVEKESLPGGKTSSYIDEDSGYTVEHGIHGFFPTYLNLKSLLLKVGIGPEIYSETVTTGMAVADKMAESNINQVTGPFPFFLWKMLPKGSFRIRDIFSASIFILRCISQAVNRDTREDDNTFKNVLRASGVSRRLIDFLLIPYVKNLSYARGEEVSAWAAMDALTYYVLERADDVKAKWLRAGPTELIFKPWMKELALRGVSFKVRTPVLTLLLDEKGRAAGCAIRKIYREKEMGVDDKLWIDRTNEKPIGLSWNGAEKILSACEAKCTHEGCPLKVAPRKGITGFQCDCHGGFFDRTGKVMQAPPVRDLAKISLKKTSIGDDNLWEVEGPTGNIDTDPLLLADYTILAVDIRGIKQIMKGQELKIPSLSNIPQLRTTAVMVLRLWFYMPPFASPDSGVFAADDLLDNFFILGRFQDEFRDLDHVVIECHIGDSEKIEMLSDDELYLEAFKCLKHYFKILSMDNLIQSRSRILRHQEVFSLFAPGDLEKTPSVSAQDRPNLFLAGDWIRSPRRSWFMERAAVTGLEAANNVLTSENLPGLTIFEKPRPPVAYRIVAFPVGLWNRSVQIFRDCFDL